MAPSAGPGMDWPTAWSALVPVYGLAVLLDAVFAPFAVLVWLIFFLYARKVLDGARLAEDPWRGGAAPRRYLLPFVAGLVVQVASYAGLTPSPSSAAVSAILGTLVALAAASLFVAASAPPGVREARAWLAIGVGAAVLSAVVFSVALFTPFAPGQALLMRLGLAGTSVGGFVIASHAGAWRGPVVARKAPKA